MNGMSMGGSESGEPPVRPPRGYDPANITQATNLLNAILDDDHLKVIGNNYARYFNYGIVAFVGVVSICYFIRRLSLSMRLRAAATNASHPARPKSLVMRWMATLTAAMREVTYLQPATTRRVVWFKVPPLGTIFLIAAYIGFVIALEFINDRTPGAQFWQARGIRAGWLSIAQVPILIFLIGKYNLVTLLTGVSFERMNILHRWIGRMVLLMALLHFGFMSYGWQKYGVTKLEWATDSCPPTGMAALAFLLWFNLSSLAPFRHFSYEFFIIQHILTFIGFIVALMYHLPTTALTSRVYIYIPIAVYLLDRIARTAFFAIVNARGGKATLTAFEGGVTKVRLTGQNLKHWSPGSYVSLTIPRFGWIQGHPASILSTPTTHNGDLILILKGHKGFTKRILDSAGSSEVSLLPETKSEKQEHSRREIVTHRAFINGPYGGSHDDFAAFDSVLLIAGSTGVTYTLSQLQDLADRASSSERRLPVRRVHFVWCVRDSSWVKWCNDEITGAYEKLQRAGIEVEISVHVTCADAFTQEHNSAKDRTCACDKSSGPCCCVLVDEKRDGAKNPNAIRPISKEVGANLETSVAEKVSDESSISSFPQDLAAGAATKLPTLRCAQFYSGRPAMIGVIEQLLNSAEGESAIVVCGPQGMSSQIRNTVVYLSDQRAIHKGTGAQGCYLHVDNFS